MRKAIKLVTIHSLLEKTRLPNVDRRERLPDRRHGYDVTSPVPLSFRKQCNSRLGAYDKDTGKRTNFQVIASSLYSVYCVEQTSFYY